MSCNCNSSPCCCNPKRGLTGPIGPAGIQGNPGPTGPQGPAGTGGGGAKVYGFAGRTGLPLLLGAGSAVPRTFFINSNLITLLDSSTYRVDQACKLKVDFELTGNEAAPGADMKIGISINGGPILVENTFAVPSQGGPGNQLSGTVILDLADQDFIYFQTFNDINVGIPGSQNSFAITFNQVN